VCWSRERNKVFVIARRDLGGLSHGGMHGCVCRWEPVPLAVGHDPAYLLWNSSYMGSEHYLLSLSFTTNMLIRYFPWVPMRGGAHVLLLPRMPYGEGAAHVPMRFYAILVTVNTGPKQFLNSLFNSSTTNWLQPGVAS
jgi:hypothetical protein